jgi:hypothetical protein
MRDTGQDRFGGINPGRRHFLKTGIAGSILLAIAAGGTLLTARSKPSDKPCDKCHWLTRSDRVLLAALVPVMLEGALPPEPAAAKRAIETVMTNFDQTVSYFTPAISGEVRQLLALLEFPITRVLLAGIRTAWEKEDTPAIRSFLKRWQTSRLALLRSGYGALHDLICGAWYADPLSWPRIHYPGPPQLR